MYSPGHQWTTLIVASTMVLASLGCRGSKPFGRFVKVTQEVDVDLPNVDPPQQRLAGSKSQPQTEVTMTAKPPTSRQAMQRNAAASRTRRTEAKPASTSRRNASVANAATQRTSRRPSSSKRRPSETVATISSKDQGELLEAFADYPPEVQKEALRRLIATTSKSAKKTDQPSGYEAMLKRQASNLPKLPAAKNSKAEVPAIRLASSQMETDGPNQSRPPSQPKPRSSSVVTVGDQSKSHTAETTESPKAATQTSKTTSAAIAKAVTETAPAGKPAIKEPINQEPATQPKPSQPKPSQTKVVQSITDMPSEEPGAIQTASATRPAGADVGMVTRAALDSGPIVTDGEPLDAASLDDKTLYQALLKKLSTVPAGESESERASRLIKLRHLMVLSGDVDSAVEKIDGMSGSEQEFIRHQLLGLWTMVDPSGHPVASRRITTALPQLRQATKFAAAATDSLEVRSLAFCTEIESYGQIKPFKSNQFNPGQQVILYCEIENFTAKEVNDGFETQMQGSYDIYDANNQKVVSQLLPADRQVSTNYLRDYYIAYQMHLPKQLPPGNYRLQLTMEDVGGKKYGQASIPLEIAK